MSETWRAGRHFPIHVYAGDRPVATFHTAEDAKRAVEAVNALGERCAEAEAEAALAAERAKVAAVEDLHAIDMLTRQTTCLECGSYWPCSTIRALTPPESEAQR